jgi:hypothetical protein
VAQVRLLARTFFARFFESELMPPGMPQAQLVIGSLVALAAPGLLLPTRFGAKYVALATRDPQALPHALLVDRLLFITLTMTAMGLVALVIWEGVFPDRRDGRILGVLPVPGRVLILSRLLALAALAGVFSLGVNAIPTVMYGPLISAYGGASNAPLGLVSHFVATACAGAFVFFLLIALQGVLLNAAGRRAAERLSVVLQALFVIVLLQMIFFLPRMGSFVHTDLRTATDSYLAVVPSIWFLALYDVLGGRPSPGSAWLATIAILATAGAVSAAVGLLVATHRRLMRRAIEGRDSGSGRAGRLVAPLLRRVSDLPWRHHVERATFEFTLRTLVRSRTHGMLMALYVGVAMALVVSGLIPVMLRLGIAGFAKPDAGLLSGPLVLAFLTLVGLRVAAGIPVEPKANWVVRLLEPADRVAVSNGARNAFLVAGAVPPTLLAAVGAALLWGPWIAIVHGIVCAVMTWLLAEVVLIGFDKVPFTSTYYPGRARLRTRWPLYLIAFTNFCFTTASLELVLLASGAYLAWFVAVGMAGIGVAWAVRAHRAREAPGLTFEEQDPDAMFQGFQLSEGLAATVGSRQTSVVSRISR